MLRENINQEHYVQTNMNKYARNWETEASLESKKQPKKTHMSIKSSQDIS